MPAGFRPAAFQNTGFQTQSGFVAAAAMGALVGETASAKKTNLAAAPIAEKAGVSSPGRITLRSASSHGVTGGLSSPGNLTFRAGIPALAGRFAHVTASHQIGVQAATRFSEIDGLTVAPVRAARVATIAYGARSGLAAPGRHTARSTASLNGRVRWLTYGGLGFQTGAFQGNAFQVVITERVTARPAASIQSRDGFSHTSRVTERPAAGFGAALRITASFGGHFFLAGALGARASHAGTGKSGRRALSTLGVLDTEISRYRSDGSGTATFAARAGLIPTSTGTAFRQGFQVNAFEQTIDNAPRAHEFGRPPTVASTINAASVSRVAKKAAPPSFATREANSPSGAVTRQAGAALGATQEAFRFRSLLQIFTGQGLFGVRGGASTTARNAGTARAAIGRASPGISGTGRLGVALTRALGAAVSAAGVGSRFVAASAQVLGARGTAAGSARTNQRPAAHADARVALLPQTIRVGAKPAGQLAAKAAIAPSFARVALSASRVILLTAQLRGVGNRTTSDSASLGERNKVASPGRITTRPSVAVGAVALGKTVGPVRVNARPVGPIGANARIPANNTRLAAVARQAIIAKLATPSIVRLGRFAAASIMRAALKVAGLFNPQLIDQGRGVTLKNDHERLRSLLRSGPRQRGLHNSRPRNRSVP